MHLFEVRVLFIELRRILQTRFQIERNNTQPCCSCEEENVRDLSQVNFWFASLFSFIVCFYILTSVSLPSSPPVPAFNSPLSYILFHCFPSEKGKPPLGISQP